MCLRYLKAKKDCLRNMPSALCKFSALHKNSGMSENSVASAISHFSSWRYNIYGGDSLPGSLWPKSLTNHWSSPTALNRTSFHLTGTLPWPSASLLYLDMMLNVIYSFLLFLPPSLITFSHFFLSLIRTDSYFTGWRDSLKVWKSIMSPQGAPHLYRWEECSPFLD